MGTTEACTVRSQQPRTHSGIAVSHGEKEQAGALSCCYWAFCIHYLIQSSRPPKKYSPYSRVHTSSERASVLSKITQHTVCGNVGPRFQGASTFSWSRVEAALCEGVSTWPGTAVSTWTAVLLTSAGWLHRHVPLLLRSLHTGCLACLPGGVCDLGRMLGSLWAQSVSVSCVTSPIWATRHPPSGLSK